MKPLLVAALVAGMGARLVPAQAGKVTDLATDSDYFANSWGLVGLKDYPSGCRITPEWHLRLADGIEAEWLLGPEGTPLPRGIRRTLPDGLPLPGSRVLLEDGVECRLGAFAGPPPGRPYDCQRRTAEECCAVKQQPECTCGGVLQGRGS
jgi:hypothetical protein